MKQKFLLLIISVLTTSCVNPQNADIDLQETLPETKLTVFSRSLPELGRINKIFGQGKLKVMVKNIVDNTGTSLPTEGEIPRDITEMLKSALNGVGGDIFYIPYDPDFMINTATTGYSDWGNKELPDIVLSGGITEFDRALVTKGESSDFGGELEMIPISIEVSDQSKNSLASITLDFNLIDFDTFTGIPHMQAINNIKVHKGLRNDSLGFTVYGATIGVRGTMKKIQGRHAAVRLLVQLSLIQVLGRYQQLPYWKVLPGVEEDPVVIDLVTENFFTLSPQDRIAKVQEYLVLIGKNVSITGVLDNNTRAALNEVAGANTTGELGIKQFLTVYRRVPLDISVLGKRSLVNTMIASYRSGVAPTQSTAVQNTRTIEITTTNSESQQPGNITLSTNSADFNIGEQLVVSFTVDKPMYVRLVTVNSEGKVANLFPNPYQSDNYAKPGVQYQIPPRNAKFALKIRGPVGTDKIRALAGVNPVTAEDIQMNSDGSFKVDPIASNLATAKQDIVIR
jgi:hypothetical protein